MLSLDLNEHAKWLSDDGDLTHLLNYPLDSNSVVMDIGGFKGAWANQILEKYNSNLYIIEPIQFLKLMGIKKETKKSYSISRKKKSIRH